jgi:hypothetical protein
MKVKHLRRKALSSHNLTPSIKTFARLASDDLLEECIYNANVQKPYFELTMQANKGNDRLEVCKAFYQHMNMQFSQLYNNIASGQAATALVTIAMDNDLTDYFYEHITMKEVKL